MINNNAVNICTQNQNESFEITLKQFSRNRYLEY